MKWFRLVFLDPGPHCLSGLCFSTPDSNTIKCYRSQLIIDSFMCLAARGTPKTCRAVGLEERGTLMC